MTCHCTKKHTALTPESLAAAYERVQEGEPLKVVAMESGVDASTLSRHIIAAEAYGLCSFYRKRHCARRA